MKTPMERVAEAKAKIQEISVTEYQASYSSNSLIVDVREADEYEDGHIDNAINIPRGVLEFEINKHCEQQGPNTPLVLYCKTGGRSALAAESLKDLGFTTIVSLAGGIEAWDNK